MHMEKKETTLQCGIKGVFLLKVAIGQDSHRIDYNNKSKKLILGGIEFEEEYSLLGNSDADVVLHSITNAVSGITCKNIIGKVSDDMCKNGITNSEEYLKEALMYLENRILHLSISIECKKPKITPKIQEMRKNIARILNISEDCVGITATTGEGLTEFGKGNRNKRLFLYYSRLSMKKIVFLINERK